LKEVLGYRVLVKDRVYHGSWGTVWTPSDMEVIVWDETMRERAEQ